MTEPEGHWLPPPQSLILPGEGVHIWRLSLVLSQDYIGQLMSVLSVDEREHAAGFHFERHRKRFIVRRGILRTILGRYLGLAPSDILFHRSKYGKPRLSPEINHYSLAFNTSHSGDWGLCAFTCGRQIGVDIERVRDDIEYETISKRFFSDAELTALQGLPAWARLQAFFRCWTRKEAYIKARGEGLSLPLDSFSVSLVPEQSEALLLHGDDPAKSTGLTLHELHVGAGYEAALAIESNDRQLICYAWPDVGREQ